VNVIDSIDQLRACSRLPAVLRFLGSIPDYRFALPAFSEADNLIATQKLTNYRRACGCFAGGLVMSVCVIGFAASYFIGGRHITDFGAKDLLLFFALFTVSTFAGKALGLLWARVRAIQLVRRIAALPA
jgi:hypothetical protein